MTNETKTKCYRLNPEATYKNIDSGLMDQGGGEMFAELPVGYKVGSIHGGFEIMDGASSDYTLNEAVLLEQAKFARVIAPVADILWGPSFRVWQHGEPAADSSCVQLFLPKPKTDKSIYVRRPCVLFSTKALDESLSKLTPKDAKEGDPRLNEARKLAAMAAWKAISAELARHAHEEYFYELIEGRVGRRMQRWEEAERYLAQEWRDFVQGFVLMGIKEADVEINPIKIEKSLKLYHHHRAIWTGSLGRHLARMNHTVELAADLQALLPPKPLHLPKASL